MSIIDKILGRKPPAEANVTVDASHHVDPHIKEENTLEYIEEGALNLLIDALHTEKEKILSDAFLLTQQDSREKISYNDMVIALQKNGFSVELLNTD